MDREAAVTAALSADSRIVAATDLLTSDLSGEMVLLHLADGVYYGLDVVGAHVWRLLDRPRTIRAIVDDVVAHYDVERARCESDVLAFLGDLRSHELIAIVPPGHE